MVRRIAENGTGYHEPPYTEEEAFEIYKGLSYEGGATIIHGPRPPAVSPQPPPEAPPPPAEPPPPEEK